MWVQRETKVRPKAGQILVLAQPLMFTDGAVHSRFLVVERTVRNRKRLAFRGDNGMFNHLRSLRDREYTLEESPEERRVPAVTAPAQPLLF